MPGPGPRFLVRTATLEASVVKPVLSHVITERAEQQSQSATPSPRIMIGNLEQRRAFSEAFDQV